MKDQHKHIKGYRDLSQEEIDMMNNIKAAAESVREVIQKAQDGLSDTKCPAEGQRWLDIANDHLQQGFMAAVRSVAQPTTY